MEYTSEPQKQLGQQNGVDITLSQWKQEREKTMTDLQNHRAAVNLYNIREQAGYEGFTNEQGELVKKPARSMMDVLKDLNSNHAKEKELIAELNKLFGK